jgi:hypothetical protein
VGALDDGADDDAGAALLARDLGHRGVADREVGRAAEHGGKGLGVAAGGGDVHLQAVLLEDAGVHADVEVDVAEVVHRLAEVHLLQLLGAHRKPRGGQRDGAAHHRGELAAGDWQARKNVRHWVPLLSDAQGLRPVASDPAVSGVAAPSAGERLASAPPRSS